MYQTLLSPLSEIQRVFDMMDRTIGQLGSEGNSQRNGLSVSYTLPIDVWQNGATIFVRAAVPGISPESLELQFQDGVLTLSGETSLPGEHEEGVRIWRREYACGRFSRSVRLPENVIDEKIEAKFENGFVTVSVPLLIQERKAIKIPLQSGNTGGQKALSENNRDESKKSR